MKKAKKQAFNLMKTTVGLSVGSQVLGEIGSDIAIKGQQAVGKVADFFPAIGTAVGGNVVLRSLDVINKSIPKNKR